MKDILKREYEKLRPDEKAQVLKEVKRLIAIREATKDRESAEE